MRDSDVDIPVLGFLGLDLELVCLAKHSVYLHFSGKTASISTTLDCIFDNQLGIRGMEPLRVLHRIIGYQVNRAFMKPGSDIVLVFDANNELLIRNSNLNTESYIVELSGVSYVV